MASLVFTHIEAINKREGGLAWRVITGAGIYTLTPNSPVARNIEASQFAGKVVIAVSARCRNTRRDQHIRTDQLPIDPEPIPSDTAGT